MAFKVLQGYINHQKWLLRPNFGHFEHFWALNQPKLEFFAQDMTPKPFRHKFIPFLNSYGNNFPIFPKKNEKKSEFVLEICSPSYMDPVILISLVVLYYYCLNVAQLVKLCFFRHFLMWIFVKTSNFAQFQLVCDHVMDLRTDGRTKPHFARCENAFKNENELSLNREILSVYVYERLIISIYIYI